MIERGEDGRIKVNPLAHWDGVAIDAYFAAHDLPRHPLQARGYASIGCATCTRAVRPGEDPRSGRWSGTSKIECGIHVRHAAREQIGMNKPSANEGIKERSNFLRGTIAARARGARERRDLRRRHAAHQVPRHLPAG